MTKRKAPVVMIAEQTRNADGSITIRPVAVVDDRDIGTGEAAKMLGLGKDSIFNLCKLGTKAGGLSAWKLPSARGNASWRISLQGVLEYKERRSKVATE